MEGTGGNALERRAQWMSNGDFRASTFTVYTTAEVDAKIQSLQTSQQKSEQGLNDTLGAYAKQYGDKIDELGSNVELLQRQIAAQSAKAAGASSVGLESEVTSHWEEIALLQSNASKLEAELECLQQQILNVRKKIDDTVCVSLVGEGASHSEQIESVRNQVDELRGESRRYSWGLVLLVGALVGRFGINVTRNAKHRWSTHSAQPRAGD